MNKLFYEDTYIREFTADVIESKEKDGNFHITLDKTAFFPGGGGQFCDLGKIDNCEVTKVYEENGVIYHVLKHKPKNNRNLKCSIDWERRQDGMHQHLGQHVLSGCFFKLFNANTVSFHLGNDVSTVDIKGHLDEEKIRIAEQYANKVIAENIQVQSFLPQESELKQLNLRRDLPKTNEDIRVVKVGELDINACCGVHPDNTQELRMIKIKAWEKHKEGTRIEFLCGERAIEDTLKKVNVLTEICRYLSSNDEDAIKCIKNLSQQLKASLDENKRISDEIISYEMKALIEKAENIGAYFVIKYIYENRNVKQLSKLATKLAAENDTIALLAVKNGEKANLIFASSKNIKGISMKELLKDILPLIEGSGGGSDYLAQGSGRATHVESGMCQVSSAIDMASSKIANYLLNLKP